MRTNSWYLSLHWTARFFAVLIAGFIFLFFLGEGAGPRGTYSLIPSNLSFRDGALLALVLGSAVAMLLAWFWEKWAGAVDVVLGAAFLMCCLIMQSMHRVWFLGAALILPGALYLAAACIHSQTQHAVGAH